MEIEKLQKIIDDTEYWDCRILDFSANYFGDEINKIIEDEKEFCYIIKFIMCYKVKYETDAKNRWKEVEVKKMNKSQLAYFAHDITANRSAESNFIEVNVSLAPLFAQIICKDIIVTHVKYKNTDFFWNNNA